jgi:uncharacterized membrane protein YsdA (DUF1294 family)
MKYLLVYLIIVNALTLLFMLVDKVKAKRNLWRIPERTLLSLCALGGSLGGLLGMKLFRHKTLHLRFSIGIPVMLAVHVVILVFLVIRFA